MNQNQWNGGQRHGGGDWQPQAHSQAQAWEEQQRAASAAYAADSERVSFIRRTYTHVMGAIFACVAMMALFMNSPFFEPILHFMLTSNWLIVLAIFMAFSWAGDWMAHNVESKGLAYIGLLVGVGAYAIILTPMIVIAQMTMETQVILHAMVLTGITFAVLTGVVFYTAKDFSVLRTGLIVMTFLALGAIIAGSLFGFTLGLGFSVAMVGFSSAIIIYQTSNVLHHYRTDQHVGAALGLFSSIGMLFWYILRIFMALNN